MACFGKRSGGGRRKSGRVQAVTTAVAITVGRSRPVLLNEMSCTGACVEAQDLLSVNDPLILKIGQFEAFGTVRWVRGGRYGIQFDQPIEKTALDRVRSEANALMGSSAYLERMLAFDDWSTGFAR